MVGGISITDIGSHAGRVELYMDYPYQAHICMQNCKTIYIPYNCVATLENQSYI